MAELIIRIRVPDQAHLHPASTDPEELAGDVIRVFNEALRGDESGDSQVELTGAGWVPNPPARRSLLRGLIRRKPEGS